MNLDQLADVRPEKIAKLRSDIARARLDLGLVEESFVKGSGKGGQKINKTASCVMLRYAPLGLVVRCQRERKRSLNRFLALRTLVELVLADDPDAPRTTRVVHVRKQKDRRKRRARTGSHNAR